MADNYNKEDLKEVLFLTKSIGKEMDKLAASSDKRNKNGGLFTPMYKGTPVHVKAAWIYNDFW